MSLCFLNFSTSHPNIPLSPYSHRLTKRALQKQGLLSIQSFGMISLEPVEFYSPCNLFKMSDGDAIAGTPLNNQVALPEEEPNAILEEILVYVVSLNG